MHNWKNFTSSDSQGKILKTLSAKPSLKYCQVTNAVWLLLNFEDISGWAMREQDRLLDVISVFMWHASKIILEKKSWKLKNLAKVYLNLPLHQIARFLSFSHHRSLRRLPLISPSLLQAFWLWSRVKSKPHVIDSEELLKVSYLSKW